MDGIGPRDIMARKCNDCFSISEIVQYEILGFAERGEGAQLIESGATSLPSGRLPVKAGGGLIGDGHPVGATGVRQVAGGVHAAHRQAGARQIDGAKRFPISNIGCSVKTSVVVVWEAF